VSSVLLGARNTGQLRDNLRCLELELAPVVVDLLSDASQEVLTKLGENMDPYEGAETTRIK
jgi:aryl-alcohol dehydrogenase-like predicted oxidoreductase